jgi:hypothetical protein
MIEDLETQKYATQKQYFPSVQRRHFKLSNCLTHQQRGHQPNAWLAACSHLQSISPSRSHTFLKGETFSIE